MDMTGYIDLQFLERNLDSQKLEKFIFKIAEKTGLTFLSQRNKNHNLCQIEADEITSGYRLFFDLDDLHAYLSVNKIKKEDFLSNEIPTPANVEDFWKQVESY